MYRWRMRASPLQWIQWIIATATAAAILVSFAYTNFATKADAEHIDKKVVSIYEMLDHRLERIENKIDRLSSN